MQTTAADPLIGRTLEGRYRILERIARGGMSTVYAAVDERLDRLVAVKVMSAALSADPAFSDRFAREARAAARLTHINAVSVYDQGLDSGPSGHHVFLVMELVEGRTLRQLLRERGRLGPAEAVTIMEPVLGALSAAHRAGLVHRDIKPENILLSDEGVVKVADFGLARAVESDTAATRTGLMMGTVAYCSPEQVSRGRADPRSDVYSAGIVLFELLTGAPPYRGESAMNIAYQHVHSRVPAPSSRVKGVPYELDELVVTATDSDPSGRPADAGAFLAEVADARERLRLPVVPVPARPRAHGRTGGAAPARAAAASADARTDLLQVQADTYDTLVTRPAGSNGSGPTGSAGQGPPPARPVTPEPQASPPPRKSTRHRGAVIAFLVVLLLGAAAAYGGWWIAAGRYSRVPTVSSRQLADAEAALRHAHYKVGPVSTRFSETVRPGMVIGTEPRPGSRLVRGRQVAIIVSKGKERFTVPGVADDTEAAARTALAAIPVQVVSATGSKFSGSVKSGLVIGTEPPAGTRVRRNQAITIIVSRGPPMVAIPTIRPNTSFDDAAKLLTGAGFKVTRDDEFSSTVPPGIVVGTDTTGSAVKGTTITVMVSKGPQTVVIPPIARLTPAAAATAQLQGLGLVVVVQKDFGGEAGLVVGMSPAAGTTVAVGSTVTLTIV